MTDVTNNCLLMFFDLCKEMSLDQRNFDHVLTLILLMQSNVDEKSVYDGLFQHHVDWDRLGETQRQTRKFEDCGAWVALMRYISIAPECHSSMSRLEIFTHLSDCLNAAGLDKIQPLDVIKLFLLLNLRNISKTHMIARFYSVVYQTDIAPQLKEFFCKYADKVFDKSDRTKAVGIALRHCSVDKVTFKAEVSLMESREQLVRDVFQCKLQVNHCRPQLRKKVRMEGRVLNTTDIDLFSNWCDVIRFPVMFSSDQKKRLYFLMSQPILDYGETLQTFLKDPTILQTLKACPVRSPEAEILAATIQRCSISEAPFPALHKFRDEAFMSFNLQQRKTLTLNTILHLYIAAHQIDWREVWKLIVPAMSHQIGKDVDEFVRHNEYDLNSVLRIMFSVEN